MLLDWVTLGRGMAAAERFVRRGARGQGMVEYALILCFVSVVAIVILTTLGSQVSNVFNNVSQNLGLSPANGS